jgi:hypothetical protein
VSALPITRKQFYSLPLLSLPMGLLSSMGYSKWLGWPGALKLGAGFALCLFALTAWQAYRSDFAARQGVLAAAIFSMAFVPFAAGCSVAAAQVAGSEALVPWVLLVATGTMLLPLLGVAWLEQRRLRALGFKGDWVKQNVDPDAGRMRAEALIRQPEAAQRVLPWWFAIAVVNIPLLWRMHGVSDNQMLPWVMMAFTMIVAWVMVVYVGPVLGKSLFLLQLERHTGQRLVHEHFEEIQELRRSFWLSRWFMKRD